MVGKVIRCDEAKGTGIIFSMTNHRTYPYKETNSLDGALKYNYIVNFYVHMDEESGRRYAGNISVIESSIGIYGDNKKNNRSQKGHKKHKKRNVDRFIYDNRKFNRFVKQFMGGQKGS